MIAHLNPHGEGKENFLHRHGEEKTKDWVTGLAWETIENSGNFLVVLSYNSIYTDGIICYSKQELEYLQRQVTQDTMIRRFFIVPNEVLWANSSLGECVPQKMYFERLNSTTKTY